MQVWIEHITIRASTLKKLKDMKKFYETFFDAKADGSYKRPDGSLKLYFLKFASGARLELTFEPQLKGRPHDIHSPGYTHLAFRVESCANVNELTETLERQGYKPEDGPRKTGDGYWESRVRDPGGNLIEITSDLEHNRLLENETG